MHKGFVFGKFYPFHKGHQELIEFGAQNCEALIVLVCASNDESIPGEMRSDWIKRTYANNPRISVELFKYNESELPNTSQASSFVAELWSTVFKELVPEAEIVFTSEPYGEMVAKSMSIKHIACDPARNQNEVSGTLIRNSPLEYWDFLPEVVRPFYVKKIVLLGTESTGKSVLCERLAKAFETNYVSETGRELVEKTEECTYDDLNAIATLHAQRIEKEIINANRLLFIDTDIHVTKSYARFLFNREFNPSKEVVDSNRGDLYFYLDAGCEFVQDGTRLDEDQRNQLDNLHQQVLKENNIHYLLIGGSWEDRYNSIFNAVTSRISNY